MRKTTQRIVTALAASLLLAVPAFAQDAVEVIADAGEVLDDLDCSGEGGTDVTVDGTFSTVDGQPAAADPNTTFLWTAPGIIFVAPTDPTTTGTFPVGDTIVTLKVTHTQPATPPEEPVVTFDEDEVVVSVGDDTPPTIEVVADPMVLWPPNHKLHEVTVDLVVMDTCDPNPTVVLSELISSEDDNGQGDGNTVNDIQEADVGTDDRTFLVRAERMGGGTGRTYTATYTAGDATGNSTPGVVQIQVPHDQGELKAAKAAAKAAEKMAKASEKAQAKGDKKAAKQAAKAARQAANAAKKAARQAAKAAKRGN